MSTELCSSVAAPLEVSDASGAGSVPGEADPVSAFMLNLRQGRWHSLTLSKYRGAELGLRQLMVRPVILRDQAQLSMVWRYATRDVTKNVLPDEGYGFIAQLLSHDFQHAHLHGNDQVMQLTISRKGRGHLTSRSVQTPQNSPAATTHDRRKVRYLEQGRPWLQALGVTDAQQQVIPSMSRKWKQINKFLEVFSHAFEGSALAAQSAVSVVDFGAGKGYLTFAIHDFLRTQKNIHAEVTGVELRNDLVQVCRSAIQRCSLEGLQFSQGDVRSRPLHAVDVMIALHACDIATDYAIHSGIRAGAQIIMCSPCCHKQLRPQLLSPHPIKPLLQHGIHLGQEAEMLTDGLRALLLEASGYATQVFEFIALEHTSKNKMILAVKRPQAQDVSEIWRQIAEIKAFYGVKEQCLESLLRSEVGASIHAD